MNISSPAFGHKQPIPERYTCDGRGISPPLVFTSLPGNTASLALIMYDSGAPSGALMHWLVYGIPAKSSGTGENGLPPGSLPGTNSMGRTRYDAPCHTDSVHRYVFRLYALDFALNISKGASRQTLESAMHGHIIDRADLIGLYQGGDSKK